MNGLNDIILSNRSTFSGTLYMCKSKRYLPSEPSGYAGRYSGFGTYAYYLSDSPLACWREVKGYCPDAQSVDYVMWQVQITGTFVDVGALAGTRFLMPKSDGGWEPTQELSRSLADASILGFRYPSRQAIEEQGSGTCFCVYRKQMSLDDKDFALQACPR